MLRRIRDVLQSPVTVQLPPTATVLAAARLMAAKKQCAALVLSKQRLEGIFTEQDAVRRIIASGHDPAQTKLCDVMTEDPDTIGPDEPAIKGLQMMEDGGYRHLPVIQNGRILGVISRSDYLSEERADLKPEPHFGERIALSFPLEIGLPPLC